MFIIVGYELLPRGDMLTPKFEDTPRKKAADYAEDFAKLAQNEGLPWNCRLTKATLLSIPEGRMISLDIKDEGRPVACRLNDWILSHPSSGDGLRPMFVGFDVKRFVKMMALECAEAAAAPTSDEHPMDGELWWGHSDYRDAWSMVFPDETAKTYNWDLTIPLTRLGLGIPAPAKVADLIKPLELWRTAGQVYLPHATGRNHRLDALLVNQLMILMGLHHTRAPDAEIAKVPA